MITVTRLDSTKLVVNSDLIEFIEEIPETMICLTTGKKIMVKESVEEIVGMVTAFKRDSYGFVVGSREEKTSDA